MEQDDRAQTKGRWVLRCPICWSDRNDLYLGGRISLQLKKCLDCGYIGVAFIEVQDRFLDVVDETNRIIGRSTRDTIHSTGLWHRGVHVLLCDAEDRFILQVRAPNKDTFPRHYDCSVSEHVQEGEAYADAAERGLREELSLADVALTKVARFKLHYGPNDNMISELYVGQYDGPLQFDPQEIQRLEAFSVAELQELLVDKVNRLAPWTWEILNWYLNRPSNIHILDDHVRLWETIDTVS